jgi:hypothetical protein
MTDKGRFHSPTCDLVAGPPQHGFAAWMGGQATVP